MKPNVLARLSLAGFTVLSGCRAAARVAEVPRVDLDLSGGNRGYLVGTPPEAPSMKTTRQMLQTDIELPSAYTPTRGGKRMLEGVAPPKMDMSEEGGEEPARNTASQTDDAYVVKQGDSLWSIAAKSEVYGTSTRWRRIFNANRDVLKRPDRLRPGMTLKIPRAGEAVRAKKAPSSTESVGTFTK